MKWIQKLKSESGKKFRFLPAETSEIFKYQTFFKDFTDNLTTNDLTGLKGYDVDIEGCKPEIVPIIERDIGEFSEWMTKTEDKFDHMNNALFESGIVIETLPGETGSVVKIRPSKSGGIFRKIIVLAGKNSGIDIVKESANSYADNMISESVLVIASEGAQIRFSEIQNYKPSIVCFSNKTSVCMGDARVSWNSGIFGGLKTRMRSYNFMKGDGSEAEDFQLMFGSGSQEFDSFSNLFHIGRSTSGKSVMKGVFSENSKSFMKGMIKIQYGAKKSSAYLASHGMLIGKSAKCNAIPGLEIETNDVKATHSASVSPIDEEKIFYMMCRGLSDVDAKMMLTVGFFDPLIARMGSKEMRAKIRHMIESKWSNGSGPGKRPLEEIVDEDTIRFSEMFEGHYKYRR
jgi:Fe-S cluster assembly scaffold protein SufB